MMLDLGNNMGHSSDCDLTEITAESKKVKLCE